MDERMMTYGQRLTHYANDVNEVFCRRLNISHVDIENVNSATTEKNIYKEICTESLEGISVQYFNEPGKFLMYFIEKIKESGKQQDLAIVKWKNINVEVVRTDNKESLRISIKVDVQEPKVKTVN